MITNHKHHWGDYHVEHHGHRGDYFHQNHHRFYHDHPHYHWRHQHHLHRHNRFDAAIPCPRLLDSERVNDTFDDNGTARSSYCRP